MNKFSNSMPRDGRPRSRRSIAFLGVAALTLGLGSASSSVAAPTTTTVQAAQAAAAVGAGSGHRHHHRYRHHHSRSSHRYYGSFYLGFPRYWGFGYHHGYPYAYGHPYRYGRYAGGGEPLGGIDINVRPKRAEVFVDGSPVGTVRQFDGFPSFLWLEKGTYDVVVYLDGFETLNRQVSVYPGVVVDYSGRMEPGEAVRPEAIGPTSTKNRDERHKRNRERADAAARSAPTGGDSPGRIAFSVWPADAVVYLDGHFLGAADELAHVSAGLIVEPGRHTIEIVRPGFVSVQREVEIEAGERLDLDLELDER